MLEFVFWDVQHGSAAYIKTPNNRHMVVDLGTGSYSGNKPFSPLLHLKNKYGVNHLDYVVITHPHRDHIDDIFLFQDLNPQTLRLMIASSLQLGTNSSSLPLLSQTMTFSPCVRSTTG
jgi:competence protein ComEC